MEHREVEASAGYSMHGGRAVPEASTACHGRPAGTEQARTEFDVVVDFLGRCVAVADREQEGCSIPISIFHGQEAPDISVRDYMLRIKSFSGCSQSCFVLAIMYLDHLARTDSDFELCSLNMHRLVLVATMVASKFVDDECSSNHIWAKIGGVQANELNMMEVEFLFLVNFKLLYQGTDFKGCLKTLDKRCCQHLKAIPQPAPKSSICRALEALGMYGRALDISPSGVVEGNTLFHWMSVGWDSKKGLKSRPGLVCVDEDEREVAGAKSDQPMEKGESG